MPSNNPNNKTPQLDEDTKLLSGLQSNQATLPSFLIASKTYTPADCVNIMQGRVNVGLAAVTAKAQARTAVQANRDERAQTKPFVRDLKKELVLMYSDQPAKLAEFGLVPHKTPTPLTTEEKLITVAKRNATRKARNTMGSKKRKTVKGSVPSTISVAVPVAAPAAPDAPAAAAPSPGNASPTLGDSPKPPAPHAPTGAGSQ